MAGERTTAQWYRTFAEVETLGQSPLFEEWAFGIAEDPMVVSLIDSLPLQKRQPNLVFASSRWVGAPLGAYSEYRDWLLAHWPEVADVARARRTQTNEPRRCAAILPALALIPGPIALLELGASAGLCLYPDRYSYRFADGQWLHPESGPSTVTIETVASGDMPIPRVMPQIVWRAGIDLDPVDVRNEADLRWLETLVWPEQGERLVRIRAAAEIVSADPPLLVRGSAGEELEALASTAPLDATLVVLTSAVLVYIPYLERMQLVENIRALGARWISLDGVGVLPDVDALRGEAIPGQFTLSLDGKPLADVGPHGQFVSWLPSDAAVPQ